MFPGLSNHPTILSAVPHQETLLIAEATFISHDAGGLSHVPGIYTDAQIEGRKKTTVHAKGSYMCLQLWALGRAADIDFLKGQDPPSPYVSASSVTMTSQSKAPRPLTEDEIKDHIATYAKAAKEGRTRFSREVVDAVMDVVGEGRVDTRMPDLRPTFAYITTALRDKYPELAYLHVTEPRIAGNIDCAQSPDNNNDFLREIWNGGGCGKERVFISAGGYTRETASRTAKDQGGLIAFGRMYIPNSDLPERLQKNLPLTHGAQSTYLMAGNLTPSGYNDWPFISGNVEGIDGKLRRNAPLDETKNRSYCQIHL